MRLGRSKEHKTTEYVQQHTTVAGNLHLLYTIHFWNYFHDIKPSIIKFPDQ